jgi:hypothetical protein
MAFILAILRELLAALVPSIIEALRRPAIRSVDDAAPRLPSIDARGDTGRSADILRRAGRLRDAD